MIKTRVAPSPTGDPHVGTAYQALFNYVFARQHGGHFVVRIEDTDRSRYVPASEGRILEMVDWIGLPPDESPAVGGPGAPYTQSEAVDIHRRHAELLLERGAAYRAFETPEELAATREENKRLGLREAGYNRRDRGLSREESDARAARGEPFAVRLKVPLAGETVVNDRLRGPVRFDNADLDDKVLLKSDGFPTYHLAAMVDDHRMGITHVIRAEEWLSSTPVHIHILEAFGWPEPQWIHTPWLLNASRKKLSKRKDDASVDSYRAKGILPEALLNYLGMMGWSMPDGREVFSVADMIEHFSWERVSLGGSIFDFEKLSWLNGKYVREVLALPDLARRAAPFLEGAGYDASDPIYVEHVVSVLRERFETLGELPEKAAYFFAEPEPDPKAARKLEEGRDLLAALLPRLENASAWDEATLEPAIRGLGEEAGVKLGAVMQPLRAALTGRLESPGMFELLSVLGRERSLERVRRAVS